MANLPNSKEMLNQLIRLKSKLGDVLNSIDFDSSNIILENEDDLEELFLYENCRSLVNHLVEVYNDIEYLSKPVVKEGILRKQPNGRYSIDGDDFEFTSGSSIEVLINKGDYPKHWIATRIEHNGRDYYIYPYKELSPEGIRARRRK